MDTYRRTYKYLLFVSSFFIFGCLSVIIFLNGNEYIEAAILALCSLYFFVIFIRLLTEKFVTSQTSITKSYKFPLRTYELNFADIEMVVLDSLSPYQFFKSRTYTLIPRKSVSKNYAFLCISPGIKNRKRLITDIVSKVNPDAYVDPSVYEYIDKAPPQTVSFHKENIPPVKVCTPLSIWFASYIGGPLVAVLLIAWNFKKFGELSKARLFLFLGIIFTILLSGSLIFIPGKILESFPPYLIAVSYSAFASSLAYNYQGREMIKHMAMGGKKVSNWVLFGVSIAGLIVTLALIFSLSGLHYYHRYTTLTFGNLKHELNYNKKIPKEDLQQFMLVLDKSLKDANHKVYFELEKFNEGYKLFIPFDEQYWDNADVISGLTALKYELENKLLNKKVQIIFIKEVPFLNRIEKEVPYSVVSSSAGNEFDEIISDLDKEIQTNHKNAEAYYKRGLMYTQNNKFDQALSDLNEALRINPDYAEAYRERGVVYVSIGSLDQAISDLNRAVELIPDSAEAYCNRSLAYAAKVNLDQALLDSNKAVEINPALAFCYYGRGLVYYRKERFDEAIADFTKAIAIDPVYSDAYCYRGIVYAVMRNFEQAISDYNKAIEINPNYADAYFCRANINYEKGSYSQSLDDFNKAESLGYKVDPGIIDKVKEKLVKK